MTFLFGVACGALVLVSLVLGLLSWVSWAHEGFTSDTWKMMGQTAIPVCLAVACALAAT